MRLNTILAALVVSGASVANQAEAQQVFVHGFATQAYGQTSDYAQNGLVGSGTADMRAAALQGRLAFLSTGTQFVVQGAHRRVGGSPIAAVIDDVELDWAFAQQRIGSFSARVGRIPIPKGLVNEIRDVGTLLPFYTASKAFYLDGVETVDGVTGSFSQSVGSFDVEAQAFKGEIPIVVSISGQDGPQAVDLDGKGAYGGQLAFGLPIQGAKILGGFFDTQIQLGAGDQISWDHRWVSAEYQADNYYGRAEQAWSFVESYQNISTFYAQAGARVWDRLWINGQHESSKAEILTPPIAGHEYQPVEDWALGASYRVSSRLVLKGEQHFSSGYALDQLVNIMGAAPSNRYFLLSMAVAF